MVFIVVIVLCKNQFLTLNVHELTKMTKKSTVDKFRYDKYQNFCRFL